MEESGEGSERLEPYAVDKLNLDKIKSMLLQTQTVINMIISAEQKKAEDVLRNHRANL